jgi:hypothetical protein
MAVIVILGRRAINDSFHGNKRSWTYYRIEVV